MAKRIYDSDMIAAWANLSPQQRLADRAAALVFAAEQIRLMAEPEESGSGLTTALVEATTRVENEVRPMLDRIASGPILGMLQRDPEVERVLVALDAQLTTGPRPAPITDRAWRDADRLASRYGLAFYYEVRRLESAWLWGLPPQPPE